MKIHHSVFFLCILIILFLSSCAKDPGEGGQASIQGKVYSQAYGDYAPEQDVYIIYGDDVSYGQRTRTSYDGAYEFKYLRKGNYKVFVYSKDNTSASGVIPIIKEVKVTKRKEVVKLDDLVILE